MRRRLYPALCLGLLTLQGCDTVPEQPSKPAITQSTPAPATYEGAMALARKGPTDQKSRHLLQAIEYALKAKQLDKAQAASKLINPTLLSIEEARTFERLSEDMTQLSGEPFLSDDYLLSLSPNQLQRFPSATQIRVIELKANQFLKQGRPLEAARLRVTNRGLFTEGTFRQNQDAIWFALKQLPAFEIMQAGGVENDAELREWLDLAGLIQPGQSLEQQLSHLNQWMADHPKHSATDVLPSELALLQKLPTSKPNRIALLLPLSGPAQKVGEAIRDGFLGAYLEGENSAANTTTIQVIDSESTPDIVSLYSNLQVEGYDLIVGPLEKEKVDTLAQLPKPTSPTLALNYTATGQSVADNFYQFGLSSEDEIDQVLRDMQSNGQSNLLAIVSTAPWTSKLLSYLESTAPAYGIRITGIEKTYDPSQLSVGIEAQLNIDESKSRTRALESVIGKVEGEPRRRQDIDAVLIMGTPVVARQVKPLLAFHYANDLPVYATSHINSGPENRARDNDLNSIRLPEAPWALNRMQDIKVIAERFVQPVYSRFFAMGMDAYQISNRLQLLQRFPDSLLQGQTGELYMTPQHQIRRHLEWAEYRDGALVALPRLL